MRRKLEKWRRNLLRKRRPPILNARTLSYLDVASTMPEERSGNVALDDEFSSVTEIVRSSTQNIAWRIEAEDISSGGAIEVPERVGAALVKIEAPDSPQTTAALFKALISAGLTPILRDREFGGARCSVLFAHSDVARSLWPTPEYGRQGEVPVLVPCFNNPTYCALMLDQLWRVGFDDIRFIDNASTSSQMQDWLRREDARRQIIRLDENIGPNQSINRLRWDLPRHFCITDPDILFNRRLPSNFVSELRGLTVRHGVGKAGFALDISRSHLFPRETLDRRDGTISEWEEQFWSKPLHFTDGGDRVFDARIDTTFCMVDQKYYRPSKTYDGVRVAGRYTAVHLPWEGQVEIQDGEKEFYARTQQHSNYGS
ncbi:glycosyltransferase family A protein [Mesorhizobium sp.]|uniref:glycosyltransferase family 2 protein n=1 Tax=Mesorhizobium sp. TaxID=1871066 RepID=UPI000FEAAAAE|nr:glycosyltransferase family A protein [Mesorhizobium sp.]RWE77592.1 MAG: glycosyltransferase family 2 protein [Mesorhizobium sp.]TIV32363.1 MAG: glycosyltransferase family 2 protein [Mesorhizobium sp.]